VKDTPVVKTEAQKWGETAIAFIGSATAAAIFFALGFFFRPPAWIVSSSRVLAVVCIVVFAVASIRIVRWWIVLARRSRRPG
jgi:membrane protein DedA with SNARE-associated domain